jgi:transposase
MTALIDTLSHGVPAALTELRTLGRTLKKRAADVLAYFERPGTSNGPTEAINGRLEHLRGSTLGPDSCHSRWSALRRGADLRVR